MVGEQPWAQDFKSFGRIYTGYGLDRLPWLIIASEVLPRLRSLGSSCGSLQVLFVKPDHELHAFDGRFL